MPSRPFEILLIEDNEADVDLTREALLSQRKPVNLSVARTGEEGLQFLSRTGHFANVARPDLILLDLNLPGMDGRDVLKEVKNDYRFRQIPIVVLTTSEADLDILKCYAMGANCYIAKPVDFESFSKVIGQLLEFWCNTVKTPQPRLVEKYRVSTDIRTPSVIYEKNRNQPIRVLHVEDSDADADLVLARLSGQSDPRFVLHRARRLSEAFEYLDARRTDVVLLDLSLPDSQGFETIISFLSHAPNLPVVILTGTEDMALGIRAVKEGAQDCIAKSKVDSEFFGRVILHAIERKNSAMAQAAALIREHEARDAAEKALGIRDEFIAIASHELRTPLATLQLQTELLAMMIQKSEMDDALKSSFRTMTEKVSDQMTRFCKLVNTMLDFSRIQSGRLQLDYSRFDLNELIVESLELLGSDLMREGCDVKMNLGARITGDWDRLRLQQVLFNILLNCAKYARKKPLEVTTSSDGEYAWIYVKDNGPGIAPKDKDRIFQRFERGNGSPEASGMGLGLYIVRQIIDSHQGTVELVSDLGMGSTFVVRLPLNRREFHGISV